MKKLRLIFCLFIAVFLGIAGGVCVFVKAMTSDNLKHDLSIAAVSLSMPKALTVNSSESRQLASPDDVPADTTSAQTNAEATSDQSIHTTDVVDIHEDEVHFPVVESRFGESGVSCSNFFIKDSMGIGTDFESLLRLPLGFDFSRSTEPQVLIFHTHTSESYLDYDLGYYHESFYPRTSDNSKNMVSVGERIAESLKRNGIGVIHATEVHDSPEYSGAYDRSWETITKYVEQYPSIKVVLDIHRDSIAGEGGAKVKPTFEVKGKKAAQMMIMAGCDTGGYYGFPDWEYNLRFALKLQECAEEMYPGMTRPLYFGDFAYNMPITRGSLLIEVGTDVNTYREAQYTGELLGNVLARVLQREG